MGADMKMEESENNPFQFILNHEENKDFTWHGNPELVYILCGSGFLSIGNEMYTVAAEDIFVINPYCLHSLIMGSGGQVLTLFFSAQLLSSVSHEAAGQFYDCRSFLHLPEMQLPFRILREKMAIAFESGYKQDSGIPFIYYGKIMELLDCMVKYFSRPPESSTKQEGMNRIQRIMRYIAEHYRENLTLEELAGMEFLTPSYLSRILKKESGLTLTEYLTRVRLNDALSRLMHTGNTITDIAYEAGFKSVNSFIEYFKQQYGMTPGQYRKQTSSHPAERAAYPARNGGSFSTVFQSLLKYVDHGGTTGRSEPEFYLPTLEQIRVDCTCQGKKIKQNWRTLMNAGYAKDILNAGVQAQLIQLQHEVGFRYLRFHGIFDDDMFVYHENAEGKAVFNFTYVDEIIDFLLSIHIDPYVEFGYMPSALAMEQMRLFQRPSFVSMPASQDKWIGLVEAFLRHCLSRFGRESMRKWMFCPFGNPELTAGSNAADTKLYFELYERTCRSIWEMDESFVICGPGSAINSLEINRAFLDYCLRRDCMPDYLAFHSFQNAVSGEENEDIQLVEQPDVFPVAVSRDEHFLRSQLHKMDELLTKIGLSDYPILLDEWNSNLWQRDLCSDTCYKSAFLFKDILENYDRPSAIGYWTLSDNMEEVAPAPELFHGGFGLFNRLNIPKSGYRALELLKKAGSRLLSKGDGYFITAGEGAIQIFLYHYCHYDVLYRYRHIAGFFGNDRYQVFHKKESRLMHVRLSGLNEGSYCIRYYSVGPEGGSAYDEWLQMGAPQYLNREEQKILEARSHPVYHTEEKAVENELVIKALLAPHEIQAIIIKKNEDYS